MTDQVSREKVLEAAETYLHAEPPPGRMNELDRVATYSNATVRRIIEAIKALPPAPPEQGWTREEFAETFRKALKKSGCAEPLTGHQRHIVSELAADIVAQRPLGAAWGSERELAEAIYQDGASYLTFGQAEAAARTALAKRPAWTEAGKRIIGKSPPTWSEEPKK